MVMVGMELLTLMLMFMDEVTTAGFGTGGGSDSYDV